MRFDRPAWRIALEADVEWWPDDPADRAGTRSLVIRRRYLLGVLQRPVLRDWLLYVWLFSLVFSRPGFGKDVPAAVRRINDGWPLPVAMIVGLIATTLFVLGGVGILRRLVRRATSAYPARLRDLESAGECPSERSP